MTQYLLSDEVLNAEAADKLVSAITDKREKALLRFLTGQTMFAMQIEGAARPSAPVDLLYIVQIGRMMYQKKKMIDGILNGNAEDHLWGED
jgi:hypothetical protein